MILYIEDKSGGISCRYVDKAKANDAFYGEFADDVLRVTLVHPRKGRVRDRRVDCPITTNLNSQENKPAEPVLETAPKVEDKPKRGRPKKESS